ncbi:MAG: acyl-CoA dehydrogenase family protein [Rhodobacteraceae bacterium]|nr:acyl-CoA dehydrogenase family protein [Paracoccaceae bacterium]
MSLFTTTSGWNEEEHSIFADSVRRFFEAEMAPHMERWNRDGICDREFWRKAGEAGIMGGSVPEAYGGSGGGYGFDSVVLYEQARCSDSAWGFGIHSIVIHYILTYGSDDQKQRWLPKLVSGESVAALAMSEPSGGSDLQSIRTTALQEGNQYRIKGSKIFITNGMTADLIIVAVKTDRQEGAKGISLVVVETGETDGFARGKKLDKLGLRGNDTAELFFDDAKVPLTNLLGDDEGQGFYQMMNQLSWERLIIAISALGSMDYALAETVDYVRQRKAFGKRIMDFQNTRFKLAEAKTKCELLRSFINDCIQRLERGELDPATASMAKYWGSQTQNEVINECLQLHGGFGYMTECPISRLYADARVQMIYGGTNEIMKELIARSIDA